MSGESLNLCCTLSACNGKWFYFCCGLRVRDCLSVSTFQNVRVKKGSGRYRRQPYRDMINVWLTLTHTGGKREDLDVNISSSQHSSRGYYTQLCQLCVCNSHCTCLFLSPSSLLFLSQTAGSPPSPAAGLKPCISNSIKDLFFSAKIWTLLTYSSFISDICVLFGCFHPSLVNLVYSSCSQYYLCKYLYQEFGVM